MFFLKGGFVLGKNNLFALFVLVCLFLYFFGCTGSDVVKKSTDTVADHNYIQYSLLDENGVVQNPQLYDEYPRDSCIKACLNEKQNGRDLSEGPCLGIVAVFYACDVAHNPREDVDNMVGNQCEDYIQGRVPHYVEVDENCNFITEN